MQPQQPFRRAVLAAILLAALFGCGRSVRAVGEPTLNIVMDNTALVIGSVSQVTFQFSAAPIGFDNSDVNLSNANGTLSNVTAGGDPRIWTATFTPNPGVNDPTNTISVGVQWTDPVGVSPLGPSVGPNYTIATASGGSSQCPSPEIAFATPKGGESFDAGDVVDVFWTANGCQVIAVRLAMSTDGGESYDVPLVTTTTPFSGYYRWTVPDVGTGAGRLRAELLAPGDIVLATAVSNGTFAVAQAPSPDPEPPPVESPPAATVETATPEETGQSATSGGETGTVPQETAASSAPTPTEPSPPPPQPAPRLTTRPRPAPQPPTPPIALATAPETQAPAPQTIETTEQATTMPETNENQAISLDAVQGVVETASEFAPPYAQLGFSFALGALAMLAAMLGARKMLRDARDRQGRTCQHCRGTGEKRSEEQGTEACGDCEGSGTVEEEEEKSVECTHCKGEGADPCHECKGAGKDADGADCAACRGGGVTLDDPEDEESDEPADCEVCGGEGEVGATIKRRVTCETCHGTGRT